MNRRSVAPLFSVTLLILVLPVVLSAQGGFTTIDYPGADYTTAFGINSQGDIVGYFHLQSESPGKNHGFFLSRNGLAPVSFDYPGAISTSAMGINPAGNIVGGYQDSTGKQHGYLFHNGQFTQIDVPESTFTAAFGINPEGDITGHFGSKPTGKMKVFLLRRGQFTTYDYPEPNFMTCAVGINPAGTIVGHYAIATGKHGFILNDGAFTTVDIQDGKGVDVTGINANNEIVGNFTDVKTNLIHGFVIAGGVVTQIDVPVEDATKTWVRRNNARGDLVGEYQDAAGFTHGFLMRGQQ